MVASGGSAAVTVRHPRRSDLGTTKQSWFVKGPPRAGSWLDGRRARNQVRTGIDDAAGEDGSGDADGAEVQLEQPARRTVRVGVKNLSADERNGRPPPWSPGFWRRRAWPILESAQVPGAAVLASEGACDSHEARRDGEHPDVRRASGQRAMDCVIRLPTPCGKVLSEISAWAATGASRLSEAQGWRRA